MKKQEKYTLWDELVDMGLFKATMLIWIIIIVVYCVGMGILAFFMKRF